MQDYTAPELEITVFLAEDVITTSGGDGDEGVPGPIHQFN